MDAAFPFGFPLAVAFYLTLYVLTLVLHVVFMNYVLAGTGYLAIAGVARLLKSGRNSGGDDPLLKNHTGRAAGSPVDPPARSLDSDAVLDLLREWMPFMLSGAITAGVAPLLFIQILYQRQFYTANLLLFHRWMSILPVLIVGFYLLYLLKAKAIERWPRGWRAAVGVGAFVCFAFTAYSWTENHLLSQQPSLWPEFYATGRMVYWSAELLPRLAVWFVGAIPTAAVILGWQLRHQYLHTAANGANHASSVSPADSRRVAAAALAGLVASAVAAGGYYAVAGAKVGAAAFGTLAAPYFAAAVVGWVLQAMGWTAQYLRVRRAAGGPQCLCTGWLTAATVGVGLTILGMTVVREAMRLVSADLSVLEARTAAAGRVGGLVVFLAFALINAVLIAWCVRLVRSGERPARS